MSGRDLDAHRIHHARHPDHISDRERDATEVAYRAIARGEYQHRSRSTAALDLGHDDDGPSPEAVAVVVAGLRRNAVVPLALMFGCPTCGAPAGSLCGVVGRGVCGSRVVVGIHARTLPDALREAS